MLCGRFVVSPVHEHLLRSYLPRRLVVNGVSMSAEGTGPQLSALIGLMRSESTTDNLGGYAILRALSSTLFALTLRLASESLGAPAGLLALAGQPRLAPALSALFNDPGHRWSTTELAGLCSMSRATFIRHFQENMGHSASDLLTDIRMMLAASELRRSSFPTAAIAEMAGYRSEAAFQRAFKHHIGATPAQWRRQGKEATVTHG
jgi:AraC family transcriptional activator of mtrCDE